MYNSGVKPVVIPTALLLATLAASAQVGVSPKKDITLEEVTDEKFRVGDVWEYKTRPGEERSRVTIVRIDKSPKLGIIVHVAVSNIRLANCHDGPEPDSVSHMPFARRALEVSVTKRIASNQPLPTFREGYDDWKSAYTRKKAGVYVIPVAEAVTAAEKTYRHGIGCE